MIDKLRYWTHPIANRKRKLHRFTLTRYNTFKGVIKGYGWSPWNSSRVQIQVRTKQWGSYIGWRKRVSSVRCVAAQGRGGGGGGEGSADYRTNLRDPFHALVPRTKSSNNSGITALPKWNFIRESPRSRARVSRSGADLFGSSLVPAAAVRRSEPVASSLFQFSLRFEKSSGRYATREFTGRISSWDDIIPLLRALSSTNSLRLARGAQTSCKRLARHLSLDSAFSCNFISFRRAFFSSSLAFS